VLADRRPELSARPARIIERGAPTAGKPGPTPSAIA
jgi:hypothetical protein